MKSSLFAFGVLISIFSLPVMGLAFAVSQNDAWWVFYTGLIACTFGVALCTLAVVLKCAALLFRK